MMRTDPLPKISDGFKECLSQALKRELVVAFIFRAEARNYLRDNSNDNSNGEQIPRGDDNKKDRGNCLPPPSF
jgi:hypothetical protein